MLLGVLTVSMRLVLCAVLCAPHCLGQPRFDAGQEKDWLKGILREALRSPDALARMHCVPMSLIL